MKTTLTIKDFFEITNGRISYVNESQNLIRPLLLGSDCAYITLEYENEYVKFSSLVKRNDPEVYRADLFLKRDSVTLCFTSSHYEWDALERQKVKEVSLVTLVTKACEYI